MLPQFYIDYLKAYLPSSEFLTLQILVWLLQVHRQVRIERLASRFPYSDRPASCLTGLKIRNTGHQQYINRLKLEVGGCFRKDNAYPTDLLKEKTDQGIVISGLDYTERHGYYLWICVGSGWKN